MLIAEYDYDTDIKIQRQESFAQGVAQQKAKDERILFAEREKVAQKDAEIQRLLAENQKLKAKL